MKEVSFTCGQFHVIRVVLYNVAMRWTAEQASGSKKPVTTPADDDDSTLNKR